MGTDDKLEALAAARRLAAEEDEKIAEILEEAYEAVLRVVRSLNASARNEQYIELFEIQSETVVTEERRWFGNKATSRLQEKICSVGWGWRLRDERDHFTIFQALHWFPWVGWG